MTDVQARRPRVPLSAVRIRGESVPVITVGNLRRAGLRFLVLGIPLAVVVALVSQSWLNLGAVLTVCIPLLPLALFEFWSEGFEASLTRDAMLGVAAFLIACVACMGMVLQALYLQEIQTGYDMAEAIANLPARLDGELLTAPFLGAWAFAVAFQLRVRRREQDGDHQAMAFGLLGAPCLALIATLVAALMGIGTVDFSGAAGSAVAGSISFALVGSVGGALLALLYWFVDGIEILRLGQSEPGTETEEFPSESGSTGLGSLE